MSIAVGKRFLRSLRFVEVEQPTPKGLKTGLRGVELKDNIQPLPGLFGV